MANLSDWTPRHTEIPQWIVASRSQKALAAIISLREKMIKFFPWLIDINQGIRARHIAIWFSICFDMPQGKE